MKVKYVGSRLERLKGLLERALELPNISNEPAQTEQQHLLEAHVMMSNIKPWKSEMIQPAWVFKALEICIDTRDYIQKTYGSESPYLELLNKLFFVPTQPLPLIFLHSPGLREQWEHARKSLIDLLKQVLEEEMSRRKNRLLVFNGNFFSGIFGFFRLLTFLAFPATTTLCECKFSVFSQMILHSITPFFQCEMAFSGV
ncbi:hypothetical protein [Arundinibacter roseus]|uniref:Uncharacterized protein n=1 Tax=Arundinibacter roseus TaxID=2070510 RepID=A0A4R4KM47_9BACT|nr:hypothetical protein [Arundinibacter roseus]TDB68086.1 hypothetical protein EZE20_03965 [Arundinibacter roseus]